LQCQGTHRKCFQDTFPDFSAKNILEGSWKLFYKLVKWLLPEYLGMILNM
jgi:hypothetical protein